MDGIVSLVSRILITFGLVTLLAWHAHALFVDDVGHWHLRTLYLVPMWERVGVVIFAGAIFISSPWGKWAPLKIAILLIYFTQFQSYTIDYFAVPPIVEKTRGFPYLFERIKVCDQAASWNFLLSTNEGYNFPELPLPSAINGEICDHPRQGYALDLPYIVDLKPYYEVPFEYDQVGEWLDYLLDLPEQLDAPPTLDFKPPPDENPQTL